MTMIDEAYNANPASMRAALAAFAEDPAPAAARVLMLGDMLQLGEDSPDYHRELAANVREARPDRVLLCGEEMRHLWEIIRAEYAGAWYTDASALAMDCARWLKDQDTILVKASHGAGLGKAMERLFGKPEMVRGNHV